MKIVLIVAVLGHTIFYECTGTDGLCSSSDTKNNGTNCTTVGIEKTQDATTITPDLLTDLPGQACEIGLKQCSPFEVCRTVKENNRSRTGACYCKDGYVRKKKSDPCTATERTSKSSATEFTVRILGPRTVQLPVHDVNVSAVAEWRQAEMNESASYFWTLKSAPQKDDQSTVVLEGRENRTLHLHQLVAGDYELIVRVTSGNRTVDAEWKMTVVEEQKPKNPPIAIVQPVFDTIKENTQVILDGSGSKDTDGTITEYVWTQVDGPVVPGTTDGVLGRTPTLTLSNLHPGNYSFRLSVKDDSGLQNSSLSRVYVTPVVDYPPKAVAGDCEGQFGDVAIRLPVEALYLCGNMSTDDNGIVKWKWTLKDAAKNTADMEGTGSSILKVSNLQKGDYTFQLDVEDEKGQSSSTDVHVIVMPAFNKPPVSNAGQNQTVKYPESSAILDGVLSSDDKKMSSFQWSQIEGPSNAVLINADKPRMTATQLQPGIYIFQLNVTDDDGSSDVDTVYVTVDASDNKAPVAVANDVTVSLPCNMATLDGSSSTDDAGVVRWLWTLQDDSAAGLELLGSTWKEPKLLVSHLSLGIYVFNLTVFDKQGAANYKLVKLNVAMSEKENQTVEMYLGTGFSNFTVRRQKKLSNQLQAVLETNPSWDHVAVDITKITEDPKDGSIRVLFYAMVRSFDSKAVEQIASATVVADFLEKQWSRSGLMNDFSIKRIDSLYCHSSCSGRGRCEEFTKRCVCDRYWMPNLFAYFSRGIAKDCDWSILYFTVISLLIISIPIGATCSLCRFGWRRYCTCGGVAGRTRAAARRIRRYRMLKNESPRKTKTGLRVLGGNGHVPMMSESDLSSEEETVYDRSSLLPDKSRDDERRNHHIGNGTTVA